MDIPPFPPPRPLVPPPPLPRRKENNPTRKTHHHRIEQISQGTGGKHTRKRPPKPGVPTGVAIAYVAREHKTRVEFSAVVTWNSVTKGEAGCDPNDVDKYIV